MPNGHFSNFGEQEIIAKYIELFDIDKMSHSVVDIGAGDGIRSSNTYRLFASGWTGIGIEADEAKFQRLRIAYKSFEGVAASNVLIMPDNVEEILRSHGIVHDFGVLSLDIDGNDYWVLDAILAKFRPRLVVSEYNEKIPPLIKFNVEFDPAFELRHHFFGYSIAKLDDLLQKYDYVLLEVEYNNVFIAPKETAGARGVSADEAYSCGYRDRPDRREKFAANADMEILHSLTPADAVAFLDEFYSEHRGKYTIETGKQ